MSLVSIILPTYNRALFLSDALAAIQAQQWTDWELIVVDDGSTDNTREVIQELTAGWLQSVRYIHQDNQGAYGARNTGLDHATGKYVAFYDSDDVWLPHHLSDCVEALEANTDVDWVFGACRILSLPERTEVAASTFYPDGKPRPFLNLKNRVSGKLHIIEDEHAAVCQIEHGLYCGLQNSVIRRELFADYRFDAELRNEAEDQVIVIWALAKGHRFGYLDRVHVDYCVHDANSSLAGAAKSVDKQIRLQKAIISGFERLRAQQVLSVSANRALQVRLSQEHFWNYGYSLLWKSGYRQEAISAFRKAISLWPWQWRYWKTLLICYAKSILQIGKPATNEIGCATVERNAAL